MRIRIKQHKRCEKCGHLVPLFQNQCPYCAGMPESVALVEIPMQGEKPVVMAKLMSNKHLKRILFVTAGVAALVIAIILITNAFQIDRSIYDTIDADYVIDKNKELNGFADMCDKVNRSRPLFSGNANYKSITYKRLYDYYHGFYNNADTTEKFRQTAIAEHDEKYRKPMAQSIQSVLNKWDDYVRKHDINNYLQVNVITDYLVQEDYYDRHYRPKFYFGLSYPSGEYAIKDCFVALRIDYDNISEVLDLKTLKKNDNPQQYFYLSGVDNSSFWDYHTATVEIFNLTLRDGTKIYANDINNVPENVRLYQAHRSLENEERLIKEFVDSDYVTQSDYVKNYMDAKLRAKDPECFNFVNRFIF